VRPPPRTDPARRVAFDVLRAVDERRAFANLALPAAIRAAGLTGRDAAFATELAYGAVRMRGLYDAVLEHASRRTAEAIDPPVLDALRLGAHQLLGMRVAAHAGVSSTVDLVAETSGRRPAGFANAVLRRVAERDRPAWVTVVAPDPAGDPIGHLAVAESHPRWIVDAFADALDGDLAEVAALCAADNAAPAVHLVARPGRITRAELLAALGRDGAAGRWSPYAVLLASGDPHDVDAVRDGRAGVQDEGSQVVALAVADTPISGEDTTWLDVCAGPGGKAALLAGVAHVRGGRLLAVDRSPHRAALVATALTGTPNTGTVIADGTRPAWGDGRFDRVLVDAPCSGLGALRRRPDARWRHHPEDLPALTRLQGDLLAAAIAACRPGGVVGYVTCSPHRAETRDIVAAALATGRVSEIPLADPLTGASGVGPGLQMWPHRHGTDAMYVAALSKSG
jgi:16S rRNA (cytosine967-C5)-methyltransferase